MKRQNPLDSYREYPHVISKGMRRNRRSPIAVSNDSIADVDRSQAFEIHRPGMLDERGDLTEHGRKVIIALVSKRAKMSKARYCVVWSADDCTWFDGDGRHRDGIRPPEGEMGDPWLNVRHNAPVEWCWTMELPNGGEWSHLCVRRIDADLVEVAAGQPMTLANFDEPDLPHLVDPMRHLVDDDGRLKAPPLYRGQRTTGVRDQWILTGPVQPVDDYNEIIRNPWPDDVREACERIAGMQLPRRLTDAAWRAIDPEHRGITYVGVQKAA